MRSSRLWNKIVAYHCKFFLPKTDSVTGQGKGDRFLAIADGVIGMISFWFSAAGMIALTIMMTVITVDVILRIAINRPIRGSIEIAELLMLPAIFLAAGLVQHLKGNISVDVLYNKFPRNVKFIADIFTSLLSLGICGLILRQSFIFQLYLIENRSMSNILKLTTAPFHVALVIGYILIVLVLIVQFVDTLMRAAKK